MMPIRREMIQQLVGSSEEWQKLSPEERQKAIAEVNQRMLGIVQGIQMGAAELQKKVSEAQRVADERARATALAAASKQAAAVRSRAAAAAAPAVRAAAESVASAPKTVTHRSGRPARRERTALTGSRLDVTVERNGRCCARRTPRSACPTCLRRCSRPRSASAAKCRSRSARTGATRRPTTTAGRSNRWARS
jgi:hypothetical protein